MSTAVDIDPSAWAAIDSWPAALAIVVLILAVLVWPGIAGWMNSRAARRVVEHEMRPNNGSSMKDSLGRIETTQAEQGAQLADQGRRIAALEASAERRGGLRWRH